MELKIQRSADDGISVLVHLLSNRTSESAGVLRNQRKTRGGNYIQSESVRSRVERS
jgi:hypothetical protein